MTETPEMRRKRAVEELRSICREIGCSGLSPAMCKEQPHVCAIIRRLVASKEEKP